MDLHAAYHGFYLLLIWMGKPFNGTYSQQLLVEYNLGMFSEHHHPRKLQGMGAITMDGQTGKMELTPIGEDMLAKVDIEQVGECLKSETSKPETLCALLGKIGPPFEEWKSNRPDKID